MSDRNGILLVAVVSLITIALRFLPFLIFGSKRKTPDYILFLGRVLPFAIMGMLVVYCLKHISFGSIDSFLPEFLSVALVVLLHLWKRSTLLSVGGGTLCYMLLVQLVF